MRNVKKFGAALAMVGVMAIGMTTFGTTVHASTGAPTKAAICASIESAEKSLSSSTNPFVVKYLQTLLAYLQRLEVLVGGCTGS